MRLLLCLILLVSPLSYASEKVSEDSNINSETLSSADLYPIPEPDWGIAVGLRSAHIPFATDEKVVSDFVPKMYYEGEHIFLRGENGGIRFYQDQDYTFSVLGHYRFFDIPAVYQNEFKGSRIDLGLQYEYLIKPNVPLQFELMSDSDGRTYGNANLLYKLESEDFDIQLSSRLRYKSSDFNNTYYGLNSDIGSDFDVKFGVETRYHVYQNLFLLADAKVNVLGNDTYNSKYIDSRAQGEVYLGFGFFNDKDNRGQLTLPDNHYIRWAYGWATPSNIGDILKGNTETDEYNNRLTSLFYGIPLAESLFNLPIELYFTPGFAYHFESDVQDPIREYVVAIKAYYTFKWPVRWRLGFAEGLSYVSDITYIEQQDIEEKGYKNGSQLLNYLDFSIDVNLGDTFNARSLDNLWLGYSVHHRSAIFESNSMFGRIKGGSNYNTIYLQWHF
ncbi:MAG: MipA/OmpV family protein [Psychromonas sp.]